MSRAQQNPTGRLRLASAALGVGLAAALAAGCGAGQITQTDSQLPAVNGAQAAQGPIAIRDAALAYPAGGSYPEGSDAPLVLGLVNTGSAADTLVEVTSPVAAEAELTGDTDLPGGAALAVGAPGEEAEVGGESHAHTTPLPSSSAAGSTDSHSPVVSGTHSESPAAPPSESGSATPSVSATTAAGPATTTATKLGKLEVVLKGLNTKLFPGRTVPVTFVFAKAGAITVELPIAAPSAARTKEAAGEH